ncbi:hypothetical protein MCUN1_001867 [Malassezia cuniculi]|uniref:Duf895 domain membrane protein n=1 Tax=Malassezia cuniculi TaxID=948313 RepID=A0AAF0EVE8_9BASI|nr:hypothetical protein MCUN1_001867 [Malassezia cuniculi]
MSYSEEAREGAAGAVSASHHKDDSLGHTEVASELVVPKRGQSWFRGNMFQVTVLGMSSFLAPGIWGAMAATGGGGQQSVELVNAANSSTFCLMIVTALLTSSMILVTNVRVALVFGMLGYAPYAASLYCHGKYGTEWFVVFGAVLCGISAGTFWATEGTIALAYPERSRHGIFISYWLMYRVLGQFIGGAINLGLNAHNNQAGSLSDDTYIVFVVLQCVGPLVAMLISLPHQVQRVDGTPVVIELEDTVWNEIKAVFKTFAKREVYLLIPMFWQSTFIESVIGTYAGKNFTVRARALGSLLSAVVASLANYCVGGYLDWKRLSVSFRARTAFITVYALQLGWLIFGIVKMNKLEDTPHEAIDWTDSEFHSAFAVYILLQMGYNMVYAYTYWIVGASASKGSHISRTASIVRAVESAGQAVAYGINSTSLRTDSAAGINMAFCAFSIPFSWFVVRRVGFAADGSHLYQMPIYAENDEQREEIAKSAAVDTDAVLGEAK